MKRALFFQRAGNDKIDIVVRDRAQNSIGRISLTIMNWRIARQMQAPKNVLKPLCCLVVPLADINQTQIRAEPLANPARLGQHLLEARRERAGHCDLLVGRRIHHEPGQ